MSIFNVKNFSNLNVLIAMLAIAIASAIIEISPYRMGLDKFDKFSLESVDQTLTRTLEIFAVSKVVNSVISVAKTVTVGASGVVVSGTIAPGEALDPIDRMIDDFTNWLLEAIAVIIATKMIISATQHFNIMYLSALIIALIATKHYATTTNRDKFKLFSNIWESIIIVIVMARFGFPFLNWMVSWLVHLICIDQYNESIRTLKELAGTPSESTFSAISSAKAAANAIFENSRAFITAIGALTAVLMFEVLLAPLFAAWSAWKISKLIFARR